MQIKNDYMYRDIELKLSDFLINYELFLQAFKRWN